MDGTGNTRFLQSRMLKVLAGPTEEVFRVHADVLTPSEPLRRMITGPWKENEDGVIRWSDCSAHIAGRFIQWLYYDDYECPYPTPIEVAGNKQHTSSQEGHSVEHLPASSEVPAASEAEESGSANVAGTGVKEDGSDERAAKRQKTIAAVTTLKPLKDLVGGGDVLIKKMSQAEHFDLWMGQLIYKPDELDYSVTITTHAELYVMGCLYLLDKLKDMALKRLGAVLISIGRPSPGSPIIQNTLTIAHYVYSKTCQEEDKEEPLRNLITTFVALNYASFKDSDIDSLILSQMDSDKEFVVDLMRKSMLRVENLETQQESRPPQAPFFTGPLPITHELKCPSCMWQQTHVCTSACSGYVGAPASSFKARFLNGQGLQK